MGEGRLAITRLDRTLVATIEGSVDEGALRAMVDTLSEAQTGQQADSVVFEASDCEVMDLDEFAALQRAIRVIEWLGMRGIVAGLRPGIVAYVVSSGVELGTMRSALDLELALEALSKDRDEREPEPDHEARSDSEDDSAIEFEPKGPGAV